MTTPKYLSMVLVSITLLLTLSSQVHAQCPVSTPAPEKPAPSQTPAPGQPAPTQSPAPTATPFPLSIKDVKVQDESSGVAGLGDKITVVVNCLKEALEREDKNGVPAQDQIHPENYVLFLDQVEISKLRPFLVDRELGQLHFRLTRDADSRVAWQDFLSRPKKDIILVNASVGPEGKAPLKDPKPFSFRVYSKPLLNTGVILFVAAIIGFLIAAKTTSIIRDSGPPNPVGGPRKRPYSLARAQVAWWFFIILGSFLFIGLVTWDLDTITSSSLVLMGIGTGTALGAAMVDANKRESSDNDLETLKPREAKLTASIAELKTAIADGEKVALGGDPSLAATLASRRTELATLEAELQQVRTQVDDAAAGLQKPVSGGFFTDLLTDVNGVTFHRFQIMVWTVVLGLIFMYSVWTSLTMPQFSDTLLALMGISAGTYVGFKIPEQQTSATDATNTNTVAGMNASDNAESDADTDPQNEEEGC